MCSSCQYPCSNVAWSLPLVVESPVANNVTSWPRATSPSVRSAVICSTDPDFGGGMEVATGPMCAIFRREAAMLTTSGARLVDEARQHAPGIEMLAGNLLRAPRVALVLSVDRLDAGQGLGRRCE